MLQSYINTRYSLGVSSGRDEPVLEKQKLPINFSPAPKKNVSKITTKIIFTYLVKT